MSFDEHPFKRFIVFRFFEQWQTCHGSVKHVEASSTRAYTGATRHLKRLPTFSRVVHLMSCVPFFPPLTMLRRVAMSFVIWTTGVRTPMSVGRK